MIIFLIINKLLAKFQDIPTLTSTRGGNELEQNLKTFDGLTSLPGACNVEMKSTWTLLLLFQTFQIT